MRAMARAPLGAPGSAAHAAIMVGGRSAREIAAAFRAGQSTVQTETLSLLAHIAAREPQIQAWAHVDPRQVNAEARRLVAFSEESRGPLHGLPIGIKDVLETRDMPTRYGSELYGDAVPTVDAAAVAYLRAAGALIVGKTHTVEFAAIGARPPTRNPANVAHTPGGSSSGSAAAVADGHVPLAIGTQTGGSIIRPAAFCGVWGFKPSWGLIDTGGAKTFAPSLDTIGWFGGTADDLAILLPVAGISAVGSPPTAQLRIAFCRTPMWAAAEPTTRAAFAEARARLRRSGAAVDMITLPPSFATLADDHATIMFGEGRASFRALYREHGDRLGGAFREMVDRGPTLDALRYAYDRAAAARAAFDALAADWDVIVVPSTPGTAPAGLANGGSYIFNGVWTMLHVPCVHVPMGRADDGLPIGLTAIGPRFADGRVIAAAGAIAMTLAG